MPSPLTPFLALAALIAPAALIAGAHASESFTIKSKSSALTANAIATFDEPWAMTFLPDRSALVTTKPGRLFHMTPDGRKTEVAGMWKVAYGGQGGLGDVVLHPDFRENQRIYISNVEAGKNQRTFGAIVTAATLDRSGDTPRLTNKKKIWTQMPKTRGRGHFSHRLAFDAEKKLFITSGDRQQQKPAQRFSQGLGKIIRLNDDGTVPGDNPYQDKGALAKTYWSIGHRNPLGIAFAQDGTLWAHEMGPRHGDELNLIKRGENYGWPVVSDGDNYSGRPIPDHATRPDFEAPKKSWVPAISPSGFILYSGDVFPDWKGDAFMGGLSSRALIRVDIKDGTAREAERFRWGERVREVEQGPDGAIWVLEDGDGARLLKLTPAAD